MAGDQAQMRKTLMAGVKWSPADIAKMHQQRADGWTQAQIARHWNISIGHLGRILRGETRHMAQGQPPAQDYDAFEAELIELSKRIPKPWLKRKCSFDTMDLRRRFRQRVMEMRDTQLIEMVQQYNDGLITKVELFRWIGDSINRCPHKWVNTPNAEWLPPLKDEEQYQQQLNQSSLTQRCKAVWVYLFTKG
jgi:hypothetical protein